MLVGLKGWSKTRIVGAKDNLRLSPDTCGQLRAVKAESFNRLFLLTNNLRYPGQYYDQETGLHYNWHRDYYSAAGRYVQSDPIGLDGGDNLYIYSRDNPISATDSAGLAPGCGLSDCFIQDLIDRYAPGGDLCVITCMIYAESSGRAHITNYDPNDGLTAHGCMQIKLPLWESYCKNLRPSFQWNIAADNVACGIRKRKIIIVTIKCHVLYSGHGNFSDCTSV
jgi:RHS repeat-associated protein